MHNKQGRRGRRSEDIPSVERCKKTPCSLCLIFMVKNWNMVKEKQQFTTSPSHTRGLLLKKEEN